MAQTSSAAREPSMEEILASIRRIIEDSDVSRHPIPPASSCKPRIDMPKFRAPSHIQDPAPKAEEKPHLKPVVFKDEPVLRGTVSDATDEGSVSVDDVEADAEDFFVLNAQNDDNFSEIPKPLLEKDGAPSLETQIASELNIVQTDQGSDVPAEASTVAKDEPVNLKQNSTDHILSEDTERKVSAAFQDLNHAVHSEPRRSFDDIASEILRPMLQNWLDTNLPSLVERLVREEIERVVRGEG
ncbi:PopZ family protein [Brucella gallinifaecis]|uniref:PopZ family protein n=1 Tax=Brucella gallinifaecis TaxID=215590 RepID=UPI00235FABB1|nr:PopZ family protein [Brucella gallinifaecis]